MTHFDRDRPPRMQQGGRAADPVFDPKEELYRRCRRDEVAGDRLLAARIDYKNPSVNRSKYGPPEDVVFGYPGDGVARWLVEDLPTLTSEGGTLYEFRPAHVPEPDNYAHSEIWTFRDRTRWEKPDLPKKIKLTYRLLMSDRSRVVIQP